MHPAPVRNPTLPSLDDRFVDAGVAFTLCADPREVVGTVPGVATFASARLVVERHGVHAPDRRLRRSASGDAIELRTGGATITGTLEGTHFEGRVRIAADHPWPRSAVVLPVATELAESLGGVALHAAAVESGGRVLVFVGPSGAGKSTACRLVPSAREVAADRLLVVPDGDLIRAYRIEGGEPSGLPRAVDGLPVVAILRVRHDGSREGIVPSGRARALADLRAACLTIGGADESYTLARLLAIAGRIPVATIYTRLDRSIDPRSFG